MKIFLISIFIDHNLSCLAYVLKFIVFLLKISFINIASQYFCFLVLKFFDFLIKITALSKAIELIIVGIPINDKENILFDVNILFDFISGSSIKEIAKAPLIQQSPS